tara:strand:+ start:955 stop:1140 length:186 start_codon:yes stop_codon:yes gene_type:complete
MFSTSFISHFSPCLYVSNAAGPVAVTGGFGCWAAAFLLRRGNAHTAIANKVNAANFLHTAK